MNRIATLVALSVLLSFSAYAAWSEAPAVLTPPRVEASDP